MPDQETKRYSCTFTGCDKSFSTSGHLTRHAANHSGTRKYRCDVPGCNSAFFRPDTLSQHKRIHAQRIANGIPSGSFSPLKTQVPPISSHLEIHQEPPYPSPPSFAMFSPSNVYPSATWPEPYHHKLEGQVYNPPISYQERTSNDGNFPFYRSSQQAQPLYGVPKGPQSYHQLVRRQIVPLLEIDTHRTFPENPQIGQSSKTSVSFLVD